MNTYAHVYRRHLTCVRVLAASRPGIIIHILPTAAIRESGVTFKTAYNGFETERHMYVRVMELSLV